MIDAIENCLTGEIVELSGSKIVKTFIYVLVSEITNKVIYVGKTTRPANRYNDYKNIFDFADGARDALKDHDRKTVIMVLMAVVPGNGATEEARSIYGSLIAGLELLNKQRPYIPSFEVVEAIVDDTEILNVSLDDRARLLSTPTKNLAGREKRIKKKLWEKNRWTPERRQKQSDFMKQQHAEKAFDKR